MAYSPLYAPNRPGSVHHGMNLFEEPAIKSIAEKYKKSPGQVILRYLVRLTFHPMKHDNFLRIDFARLICVCRLNAESFPFRKQIKRSV